MFTNDPLFAIRYVTADKVVNGDWVISENHRKNADKTEHYIFEEVEDQPVHPSLDARVHLFARTMYLTVSHIFVPAGAKISRPAKTHPM